MGFIAGIAGAAGAAGAAGGAAGGLAGVGSAISGGLSLASQAAGLFGGSSGGAAAGPVFNAEAAQGVNDAYFRSLLGYRGAKPNKLLFGYKPKDVFGKKLRYRPVDYEPLNDQDPGLQDLAANVTEGSLRNFGQNSRLSEAINSFLNEDAKSRVEEFDPSLLDTVKQTGQNALAASRGVLPSSDAESIVAGRNELTSLYGTPGTSRGQIAKDLGLSKLQLQTEIAPGLTQSNVNVINSLIPPQLRANPRDSQITPEQAAAIAANDNQFEANFDRNEQNLRSVIEASPDPRFQGLFNLLNALRAQDYAEDFAIAGGLSPTQTYGTDPRLGLAAPVALNSASSLFSGLSSFNGGGF